jgi:uncharacterized protein
MPRRFWLGLLLLLVSSVAVFAQNDADDAQTYSRFTVPALRERTYSSTLQSVRVLQRTSTFTKTLVRWQADGLTQYGFMNVPNAKGTYPLVLVLHGYVNPSTYRVQTYTTRYADALARAGFAVIHPNFRGHAPSQGRPDGSYRVDYAVDVLHLLNAARAQSGKGILQNVDASRVGLWGHSMGGGVSLRVAAVDSSIRAVTLYGAMSGDEAKNANQVYYVFSNRQRGLFELQTPKTWLEQISPINFLGRSSAAWSVHHGTLDEQVPVAWSRELCGVLKARGKKHECFFYSGSPHLFGRGSKVDGTFQARVTAFFKRELQ